MTIKEGLITEEDIAQITNNTFIKNLENTEFECKAAMITPAAAGAGGAAGGGLAAAATGSN